MKRMTRLKSNFVTALATLSSEFGRRLKQIPLVIHSQRAMVGEKVSMTPRQITKIWEAKSQDETDACRLRVERGRDREKERGESF